MDSFKESFNGFADDGTATRPKTTGKTAAYYKEDILPLPFDRAAIERRTEPAPVEDAVLVFG